LIAPILCIGRIDGQLAIETKRWLWKPTAPLLARRGKHGTHLLYYRSPTQGRALRLGRDRWLTSRGLR
jgi:hypothetical protein